MAEIYRGSIGADVQVVVEPREKQADFVVVTIDHGARRNTVAYQTAYQATRAARARFARLAGE